MTCKRTSRSILAISLLLTLVNLGQLAAQSGTSSAISGTVLDSSGATVANAEVKAIEVDTKTTRAEQTDPGGHYLFSQVNPGTYQVTVQTNGFAVSTSAPTPVGVGRTVTLNFSLHVQTDNQTVEVTAQQGLLTLDNSNTTTTIEAQTIKNLPNPGQDLTYVAQFAQGALMNTAGSSSDAKAPGGYGNVEFNGLPATSNGYILDGYDSNDPWLGLNIGLSTNLVIGLDAVDQSTVNTNSFSVDQGRYAVAQVNYFTKSGTNSFHGDLYEIWNGSLFNAEDYFLHANDSPGNIAKKPRSVVNEFGVSVGGPIRKNRLFFFGHYEGIRIALPIVTPTTLPTPAYQQYVLGQLATGGYDPVTGTNLPAQPAEIPFYKNMFSLLPPPGGSPVAITACPLDPSGNLLPAPTNGSLLDGSGCASQQQRSLNNSDSENLIVVKVDHTINAKDSIWYRFQQDTGLQAELTDPINSIFNSYSPQPQRTLVVGYTHIFSPTLVNQFNPGADWYSSIFEPNNYAQVAAKVSHHAYLGQRQRALHDHRRPRRYVCAGAQGDAMADQRQPDLDARSAHVALRRQYAPCRYQRLRPRRRHCADRRLQRPGGVHLWSRIHRPAELPGLLEGSGGRRQSRILRDGHLQAFSEDDPDLRHARHLEHQRHQPAAALWPHGGILPGCFA